MRVQILRPRLGPAQVQDIRGRAGTVGAGERAQTRRLHLPPDGPVRHQCAEDQFRIYSQLSHQKHRSLFTQNVICYRFVV